MKNNHTTFRNQNLFCSNCGGSFTIKFPIGIAEMNEKIKSFNLLHIDCEKTWEEPKANQSKDAKEKAMWWIANGSVGMSSKTMWNCLMGNKDFTVNHPYDPDDFSRCYKLLEVVPEWKSRVSELKALSKEWSLLADNWDTLTKMYEQNVAENWKNYESIGMYEFMETLIS